MQQIIVKKNLMEMLMGNVNATMAIMMMAQIIYALSALFFGI